MFLLGMVFVSVSFVSLTTPGDALADSTCELAVCELATADPPPTTDDVPPWKGALIDSLRLVVLEHSVRIAFQGKTRRELSGPFFADYKRSVRMPRTWRDGDGRLVNYLGHPIHGAAAGFIWLSNAERHQEPPAAWTRDYWSSRAVAMAWAIAYSAQFEFGPLSEAAIGNVGMRPGTTGWADHVITPLGALGLMVVEEAADRWIVVRVESWTTNRVIRAVVRVFFNPSRALASLAQGQMPWFRPARPLGRLR